MSEPGAVAVAGWVDRHRALLLGGILLVALALRLVSIDSKLSSDDGYSYIVASAPTIDVFLERLAAYENTPPLFYALLAVTPLDDEWWLRLPSLVASVASVGVLYAIVRPLLGTRTALLAALILAVAPSAVTFANFSRGFMVAELGLLLALWAIARRAQGGSRRWWWLYAAGAVVALYAEYNSGFVLLVLGGVAFALGRPPRREVLTFGVAPALSLLPWLGQLQRALDQIDVTKWPGVPPDPSFGRFYDIVLSLSFGRILANSFGAYAELRFVGALLAVTVATALLWRFGPRLAAREGRGEPGDARLAFWLFAGSAAGLVALHWALALVGVSGTFLSKYLTTLVPLAAVLLAAGVVLVPWRPAPVVAAIALLCGGSALGYVRDREAPSTDDVDQIRAIAEDLRAGTVLTNASEILFYLRDLDPTLDRPFDLLPSQEQRCARECPTPLLVVDQLAPPSHPRPGPGPKVTIGGYVVRLHPTPGAPDRLPAAR